MKKVIDLTKKTLGFALYLVIVSLVAYGGLIVVGELLSWLYELVCLVS